MTKRKQESVEENDENITKVRLPMYIDQKLFDSFFYRVLLKRRVTQQTGKGKKHRYATMVLIGNRNGIVGIGEAKHEDSAIATNAAKLDAVKRLDWVERFEDRTVWTNMETKLGGTRILMRPRPLGFGLRCNPHIHEILRAAGIKDVSAKVWGSRNPLNVIKATLRMLQAGHMPVNMGDGLGGRGRKMSKGSGIMPLDNMERARGRKLLPLMT
ncbi:ribosomal protein S5 domain 2-like protein [Cyathus striatus]|nr:ribosomal protein S5 domain 2-like protein [Cyathus striatus]